MVKTFNQNNIPIILLIFGTVINIACFCLCWFSYNGWTAGVSYIGVIFGQCFIGFFAHMPRKYEISKQYVQVLSLSYIVLGCVMTEAVFKAYTAGDDASNIIMSQPADFALLTWILLGLSLSVCRLSLISSCCRDKSAR